MALLEAASCGLFVVSTCVGGVPEVLPPSMIKFADSTTVDDLFKAISEAVVVSRRTVPSETHARIKTMYSWLNVCKRTEIVYHSMFLLGKPSLATRFLR